MDNKFKWDMFITSFFPLWISIITFDLWVIFNGIDMRALSDKSVAGFMKYTYSIAPVEITSIAIVIVVNIISICRINSFLELKNSSSNKSIGRVIRVKRANKLTSEFLLAYILPMIAFNFSNLRDVVLFLIYFLVLAYLCIRNNNVYTNIYLEFLGYKMYECDIECCVANKYHVYSDSIIISKIDLIAEVENNIKYWDFDNYIYICLGK